MNCNKFITIEANPEWLEFKKRKFNIDYKIYEIDNIKFIVQTRDVFTGFKFNKKYLTASHSPIFNGISYEKVLKIYKDLLFQLLNDKKIIGLKNFSLGYDFNDKKLIQKYFDFDLQEWGSLLTEINDLDELWKSYKSKIRYEVNKSKKQGLKIRILTLKDLEESLKIKNEAKKRDNLALMNKEGWKENLEFYVNSKYFFPIGIFQGDRMVASAILSYYGNTMNWGGLAVSNYAKENRLNALHCVNWWAIEKSFELGVKYFDTVGYNPYNRSKREEGIYLFKKRLANIDIRYFNMNYTKPLYKFIEWINKLR